MRPSPFKPAFHTCVFFCAANTAHFDARIRPDTPCNGAGHTIARALAQDPFGSRLALLLLMGRMKFPRPSLATSSPHLPTIATMAAGGNSVATEWWNDGPIDIEFQKPNPKTNRSQACEHYKAYKPASAVADATNRRATCDDLQNYFGLAQNVSARVSAAEQLSARGGASVMFRILGKTVAMARLRAPGHRDGRHLRGACAPWWLALPPISVGSAGRGCNRRGAQDPPHLSETDPMPGTSGYGGSPWRGALRHEGDPPSSEACATPCWTELPRELCPARVGNRPRRSATRRLRGHAPVRWPCWPPCSRRRRSWARLSA